MIYVENEKYLNDYRKVGVTTFLFALDDFCVGYKTFSLDEIEKIDVSNKYILINRVLNCQDIDKLKKILPNTNVDGLVFEDLGVYQIVKELNLNLKVILFQNHFAANSRSISYWQDKVDGIFVSNELTFKELEAISNNNYNICLHLYGYNQVMYSRRLLLTNWSKQFNIPYKNQNTIEDIATKVKFRAYENDYGTVLYSENIFNGQRLLKLNNIKFYYVNPFLIDHEKVLSFLKNFTFTDGEDEGFLDKETIYKLKEKNK